jgi:hypothetical protein
MYLVLENKNQIIFFLVIFYLHRLYNNTYAVIEVRYSQYSHILQGFVLLRVKNLLLIFLYIKQPHRLVIQLRSAIISMDSLLDFSLLGPSLLTFPLPIRFQS